MRKLLFFLTIIFVVFGVNAQDITQTIKGKIVDSESQYPLVGVTIGLFKDSVLIKATSADIDGYYRLDGIKIGRYTLIFNMLGYNSQTFNNVVLNSGKQLVYNVLLEENTTGIDAIEVLAYEKEGVVNEMSLVSSRSFRSEETEKYAGSRQDPARMASNFAGVQGTDDSRNDIVIRGNSPLGLLWRLEGVDIPSPNHFSVAGSTGSPISVLNNKTIGTSDFMTGAFSAEYGNALSGVFDLNLKNGNNEKREFTGQFGIFGTELFVEGPFSKKSKASYMIAYRYSTLQMFEAINFKLGTDAIPKYQDLTFKLNFPTKKTGVFSIWGIGGKSKIAIEPSLYTEPQEELYGKKDRDQYFSTDMGTVGISHAYPINKSTFTKVVIAQSTSKIKTLHEQIVRDSSFTLLGKYDYQGYLMKEHKTSAHFYVNKKLSIKNTLKIGITSEYLAVEMQDSLMMDTASNLWNTRLDFKGGSFLVQPYITLKHKFTENLTMVAGIHYSYYTINSNSTALEPRLSFKYKMKKNQSLSLGTGLHSQRQVSYIYAHQQALDNTYNNYSNQNKDLGLTKSAHFVLGYDNLLAKNLRLKAEVYYQYLYKLPVAVTNSSYAIINQGSGFDRFFPDSLQNTGTGENVGIELTLEKFFGKGYFFMLTGSLFDSKYTGNDGVKRNTDFNGNFATNVLVGYEKKIGKKKKNSINIGLKSTWAGGKRYGEIDKASSIAREEIVYIDSTRNDLKFANYFRIDAKLGIKFNGKKVGHEIALDLVNLLNRRNILSIAFDPDIALTQPTENPLVEQPQLGFLPVFYYKVNF